MKYLNNDVNQSFDKHELIVKATVWLEQMSMKT